MTVELLTDHYLEFLRLNGGCTGLAESTHVEMPHCWKSHVAAQLFSVNTTPPTEHLIHLLLTHLSLASFLWDIDKQC